MTLVHSRATQKVQVEDRSAEFDGSVRKSSKNRERRSYASATTTYRAMATFVRGRPSVLSANYDDREEPDPTPGIPEVKEYEMPFLNLYSQRSC